MNDQVNISELLQMESREQLAVSNSDAGSKSLSRVFQGCDTPEYFVELERAGESSEVLYSGRSLHNAALCYNAEVRLEALPRPATISVGELMNISEADPVRKAALDRARVRRALAEVTHERLKTLPLEALVEELCSTPAGAARFEAITSRRPIALATRSQVRGYSTMSVDELVIGLFSTPEDRLEFESVSREMRAELGLSGEGEAEGATLTKAAVSLLATCANLLQGLALTNSEHAPAAEALLNRIQAVLQNHLAKEVLAQA